MSIFIPKALDVSIAVISIVLPRSYGCVTDVVVCLIGIIGL